MFQIIRRQVSWLIEMRAEIWNLNTSIHVNDDVPDQSNTNKNT